MLTTTATTAGTFAAANPAFALCRSYAGKHTCPSSFAVFARPAKSAALGKFTNPLQR